MNETILRNHNFWDRVDRRRLENPLADFIDSFSDEEENEESEAEEFLDDIIERDRLINIMMRRERIEPIIQFEHYEALLRRLYNLPIVMSINLTPFEQLGQIQITHYKIDPLLQPYANPPNKIITINDIYLVEAQYDQMNNKLFPPI